MGHTDLCRMVQNFFLIETHIKWAFVQGWQFTKCSLDMEQDQKYGSPSEDQAHYSDVTDILQVYMVIILTSISCTKSLIK